MGPSFSTIPSSLLVPFQAVEFDNSAASQGPAQLAYRCIMFGQKRSTGTMTADTPYLVTNADQVATLAGRGSMLHRQAKAWFAVNTFTELWVVGVADNSGGVAATGTLAFSGTATAAGTVSLYMGGVLLSVAVAVGDTATTVGAAVAAAITAATDLPVTATATTGTVTVTHRHKGLAGNSYDMRVNYQTSGEALPAGITLVVTALASGTTNPTLTTAIANLGDSWFQVGTHPWTDATSLTALETELLSRAGGMRMIDGIFYTAANGTISSLGTLGGTRNSPYSVILSQPGDNPLVPPSEFAAAYAAQVAFNAAIDPARPFQTLPLAGILPPAEIDLYTLTERNILLLDGIGTSVVGPGGVVQIERPVTTYKTNAAGSADTSYRDSTTILTLLYLRYSFRVRIANGYPRAKLANDGAQFGPGQQVITPSIGKAEAIGWFTQMGELGLVEDVAQFKRDLICQRSTTDPNRLEWLLPPNLINQLIVGATKIQFRQ